MKKWVLMILGLLMMLVLAVPAMAQTGEPDAAQNAGTVSAPYTVEFTYDGNQYVMPGDSSVRLSAVLDEVGLTGEAEAVEISDKSLFSASNETGEWIVTAHRAFSSTEWMKVTIGGVAYEITVTDTQSPYGHNGSGTAADPWQIATAQQWQYFAQDMVNANNATYGDKYYKLTADITVDTNNTSAIFVGGSTEPFRGHFDGGGHTLTFNFSGTAGGAAPFRYVNGATIENLKVTGTISNSTGYAAGIAGYVTGNTTISNCTSSVTISSIYSGSGRFGGLVGRVENSVTLKINNCVFNGSITQSGSLDSGGFVGYNLGTANITDCLCAPGSIGVGMYSFVYDFAGGSSSLSRAYRTYHSTTSDLNQGTRVYSSAPGTPLTKKITFQNTAYYAEGAAAITDVSDGYAWKGATITPPSFGVTFDGTQLTNRTDYIAAWTNGASATVNSFDGPGTYTLTVTGKGSYAGSVTRTVTVERGDGSKEYPYLIGSEADWNSFATAVNSGNAYSGKYVKLTEDVSVSTMVGNSSDSGTFRGTFLGNSHTLTVNISGNYNAAPFRRVDGATIQDLTVAGTVHETSGYGGSLIGVSYGTTTVSNCHSTAAVTFAGYDSGGLVGENNGTLSISGCSFKGSMSGTADVGSGFVGDNKPGCSVSVKNCLFAPTSAAGGYITFVRGDGAANVTGSYYTTQYGEAQGTAVTSALPDDSICGKVTACDGLTYYRAACAVTGVSSIYSLGDSVVHPEPTVKDGGETLKKDTDYNLWWNEDSAAEGNYTLTVTGMGDYAGTVSISYKVQSSTGTFGGQTFSKGSDDTGEYFIIATADDLRNLATAVNTENTGSGKRFVQTADIDLSGENFTPIGRYTGQNQGFAEIYDGGHHTISGLSVNYDNDTMGRLLGLFGYINGGTVRNVRLISPSVQRDTGNSPEIGTIAGSANGTVENCLVIGPTVSSNDTVEAIIGAIIGERYSSGNVTNCYFYGGNQNDAIGSGGNINVSNVGRVYKVTLGENLDVLTDYEGDGLDANGFRITSGTKMGYYCKAGATVTLAAAPGKTISSASYYDGSVHAITANDGVFSFPMPAADVNVTGNFNTLNYTVAFNNNGGEGSMANMIFSGAESKALTTNGFTRAGYEFTGWNTASDGLGTPYADGATVSLLTSTNDATITLYAQWTKIPATVPTITSFPQDITLSTGYTTGGTLSVTATAADGHTLSYQWYSNTARTTEGGTIINKATAASYDVPTGLAEGNHYYYCVVSATRNDNNDTASVSVTATVTVNAKTDAGVSIDRGTKLSVLYGEAAFTLTGLVTSAGTNGAWTWTSDNTDVATVTNGTATTTVTILKASETPINITASYASDTTAGSATLALTVYKKSVTITGLTVSNKIYDGNTTATVSGTAAIDGKVGNDDVTVTAGTAAFADKNVGTDKTVTFSSYALSGTAKDNYTLSEQPASVMANITPKEVSVGSGITAGNKTYDGTTTATINCSGASFTELVENDALTISGVTGTFSDEIIGNGKTVTLNYSSAVLGGSDAWNYVLAAGGQQASTTANITSKPITITANGQSVELKGAIAMGTDKVSISSGELASGHSLHSVSIALVEGKNTNNAGEYDSTIVPSGAVIWNASSEDVTANYAITYVNGKLTVTKIKAKVTTAPTAITGLTYTGTDQQLITAGEADTVMEYALGENADTAPTTGYGDTVPSGKDVKSSYYVWYRAKADANHDASEPAVVTASIGKATINSVAVSGINTPKATENLDTEATTDTTGVTLNNSGTITWNPAAPQDGKAEYAKAYTAAVTATSAENYTFADTVTATVNGQSANVTKNDDGTLTISYTFGKTALNPVTITAADKEVTYSADGIAIPVEGMFTIPEGAGTATYAVENGTGVGTYDAQTGKLTVTKCGTITIKVSTAESDTHAAGAETTATLTVNKANNPATIAAAVSVMKSGSSVELVNNVDLAENVTLNGATGAVNYVISGDANGCTLSGSVLTIGSNTGTVTVNVTVEADDNYNPLAVTPIAVTITNKQTQTIAAESMTVTYGDTDKSVSASVNEPATGGGAISYAVKDGSTDYIDVDASTGALTIKKAGTATVIVTAAETPSYVLATKEVTVTINTKAMTVNASGYTGYVDQTAHGITVTVTDPASGYTVNYGTVEGTYDQTTSPTRTEVGTLTVYYQVTADNYITKTGSATVTISEKQPATVTKVPTAKALTYTGSPQALVSAGTAEGGEMQYALGTETEATQPYTTSIPTGIEAGTYYVWYKLIGDTNHLDFIVLRPIVVTIAAEGGSESKIDQRSLNRVPAELAGLYRNVEEIRRDMLLKVRINGEPVRAESTFLFDVALLVSFDGGKTWQPATEENFPAEGLQVMLPYPAGTNGKDFDFAVSHMFTITSTRLGTTVGGIETPVVTKTEDGLLVVFRGLSPVLISWARKGENSDPSPTVTPVPLPKTGDGANPALWLTLMILGIGAVVFLLLSARRKEDR